MTDIEGAAPAYRVVCFDLDGTLLPMDIEEFMRSYFERIGKYAASRGLDAQLFMTALKGGTKAMALSSDDRTNDQVFWTEFEKIYGPENLEGIDARKIADDFYANEFAHIGDDFECNQESARAIEILRGKGYPVVLTTMPMFPVQAIKHRLGWAGIDPSVFERITSYENSKTVKPRQTYYAENLVAMGVDGRDVLMVGNNTMEDLSFLDLGADGFLVTDWLLDPVGFDMDSIKHGSFEDFIAFVEELPECVDPTVGISKDAVSRDDMLEALKANAICEIDMDVVEGNASDIADAIASDRVPGVTQSAKGKS